MIRQEFLDSLKGMSTERAEEIVEHQGIDCFVHPYDAIVPAIAIDNTIYLWDKNGVVDMATAGDPCEVIP